MKSFILMIIGIIVATYHVTADARRRTRSKYQKQPYVEEMAHIEFDIQPFIIKSSMSDIDLEIENDNIKIEINVKFLEKSSPIKSSVLNNFLFMAQKQTFVIFDNEEEKIGIDELIRYPGFHFIFADIGAVYRRTAVSFQNSPAQIFEMRSGLVLICQIKNKFFIFKIVVPYTFNESLRYTELKKFTDSFYMTKY